MKTQPSFYYSAPCLLLLLPWHVHAQTASGIQPEVQVLLISEAEGQAQMALRSNEAGPLLLYTKVYDAGDAAGFEIIPLPAITRVEAHGRQIVRFIMENTGQPLQVQHYKRVSFEGIPQKTADSRASTVRVNVKYDLPVIISPRTLAPEESPWKHLVWKWDAGKIRVDNPSPYVVRMSQDIILLPVMKRVPLIRRTFILPGESVTLALPADTSPDAVKEVRLSPTALFGATAPDFDAPILP